MEFSDKMIRGISSPQYIDAEGRASAELFQFESNNRNDGFTEASINWYDEEHALAHLLNQRKKGGDDFQFRVGAAIIAKVWIDDLMNKPMAKELISYERKPEDDNQYHGNLLRKDNLEKSIRTVIAASMAMCVEKIIKRT